MFICESLSEEVLLTAELFGEYDWIHFTAGWVYLQHYLHCVCNVLKLIMLDQIILYTTRYIDFCFSLENLQIKMIYFLTARLGSWLYLTLHSKLFHLMTIYTQEPLSSFLMIGSRWSQIWFQVVVYYGGDLISQEINRNQACSTWIFTIILFNQL